MNAPAIKITPIPEQIKFFLLYLGDGFTTLASISDSNNSLYAKTFELPHEVDAAIKWVTEQNAFGKGVYWTVNPSKSRLNKKPSKSDIAHGRLLHRDIDPSKDASIAYQTRRADILRQIDIFKQTEPVPSLIIDSGHGCYPIYLFKDSASCEETEAACRKISKDDKDGTWNIDRLLRIPGTINWPSKTKIANYNYPEEPVMCSLVFESENRYDVEEFLHAANFIDAQSYINDQNCSPIIMESLPFKLQELIKKGVEVGARSEKFYHTVLELSQFAYTNDQIIELLESWPDGIASKYKERLSKEINRCLSKKSLNKDETFDQILKLIEDNTLTPSTGEILEKMATLTLTNSDQHLLLKKISNKNGIPISTLKLDLNHYISSRECSEDLLSANLAIELIGKDNLNFTTGSLWKWSSDGIWKKIEDREIKQFIQKVSNAKRVTSSFVNSVTELIKTEVNNPSIIFNQETSHINCRNGELKFSLELDNWVLLSHDKSHLRTTQIPIVYDTNAIAPRFSQFLNEVFEGDADQEAKIAVVEEALGYSFTVSTHLERFFILVGAGANGKSVLLSVLQELLGKNQVCAVQPSSFDNPFQRAHLFGKLANVITEIAQGAVIADDKLKSMVSGELTTAEEKFKAPFDFKPYAKHWFGTNHLPHTRDFSSALFRRTILLTFNKRFDADKRDVNLSKKLKEELPGIFNLALKGLSRLIKNGDFTYCPSSEKAKAEWRKEADQVSQFIDDICEVETGLSEASAALFRAYLNWVDAEGIRNPVNHATFTKRLALLNFEPKKGTNGTRLIAGLRIRVEDDPLL